MVCKVSYLHYHFIGVLIYYTCRSVTYVIGMMTSEYVKCCVKYRNPYKQKTDYFVDGQPLIKDCDTRDINYRINCVPYS